MPVIFRYKGIRFFFYSNEGDPREPIHVHLEGADGDAKFWVQPSVTLVESHGFDARALREFKRVIEDNEDLIERAWNEHFDNDR